MPRGSFAGEVVDLRNNSGVFGRLVGVTVEGRDAYEGKVALFDVSKETARQLEITQKVSLSYSGSREVAGASGTLRIEGVKLGETALVDRIKPTFPAPTRRGKKRGKSRVVQY